MGEVGRRDNLQLLLNRQARSILGVLPTTTQRALMRESGLTPVQVILDARQQQFTARLANAWSSKLKVLHHNPSSGAPICKVFREEHEHGRTTEGTDWPPPGEESVVRTTILDYTTAAKSATQRWAREKEPKSGQGSGCGRQIDCAQTMAEWEPQQCVNTEMNGGLAAAFWALDVWRSSTLN